MPLAFDKAKDAFICSVHGEVNQTGWLPCFQCGGDGLFDDYEDDPINNDPGDLSWCEACRGEGGWAVCGECCGSNPDVEW